MVLTISLSIEMRDFQLCWGGRTQEMELQPASHLLCKQDSSVLYTQVPPKMSFGKREKKSIDPNLLLLPKF